MGATPWIMLAAFGVGVASLVAIIAPRPRELLYFVAMLIAVGIGVAVTGPRDAAFVIALCLVLAGATLAGSYAGLAWRRKRRLALLRGRRGWQSEPRRGGH